MTNNIIGNPSRSLLIQGEELIAAMTLAWVASAFLYLLSMADKFHNDFLFLGIYQNRTGLLNAKTTSYCLSSDPQMFFTNLSQSGVTAENQNSVIHLINNNIKLFYSYFAKN